MVVHQGASRRLQSALLHLASARSSIEMTGKSVPLIGPDLLFRKGLGKDRGPYKFIFPESLFRGKIAVATCFAAEERGYSDARAEVSAT